jgi:uncharacterized protein YcaQ
VGEIEFSKEAARTMLLAAQGLSSPPERATKDDVRGTIRQMGVLQIDSISVVARSPYLVLWSRLGAYDPVWLDELLAEGRIFEYWSHAACFIPIEDYGLYRRLMLDKTDKTRVWMEAHPDALEHVMGRIRDGGAVRSAEFARTDGKAGGWWEWKPEKRALEHLFAVRALGVAVPRWVPDYFRTPKKGAAGLLEELADEGSLLRATIEDFDEPSYVHSDNAGLADEILSGSLRSSVTTLLSPFDPVVWDRARALELFGFDYKIEVYTPAARRRYGYYSLPILHDGALVGRLDAKAHRKEGRFEVKALHLEPEETVSDELVSGIAGALRDCAAWHGTPDLLIRYSDPPELAEALRSALDKGVGRAVPGK